MNKKWCSIVLAAIFSLSLGFQTAYADEPIIETELMSTLSSVEEVDVMVYLKKSADVYQVSDENRTGETQKEQLDRSRTAVVDELKRVASDTQRSLLRFLENRKETGEVRSYESFYISNSVHVIATPDIIFELEQYADIECIQYNKNVELKTSEIIPESTVHTSSTTTEWNLETLGAPQAWELYNRGEEMVIGFIDTGVDYTHTALKSNWRGYQGQDQAFVSEGNWLDLVDNSPFPIDPVKHGTSTVGVAVGRTDYQGNHIGVAPAAKWIAVRAFKDRDSSNANIIKAAEWMLAPNGDPTLAPNIVNNSWGGQNSETPWLGSIIDAWKAAGIVPVFASGNDIKYGGGYGSIENPASLLNAFAVGAIGEDMKIAYFSKKGPSPFDVTQKVIKPEVVGPGILIRSTLPNESYGRIQGTSIAAPHISGLIALLKAENPHLNVEQMEDIITYTATPLVDSQYTVSPNMAYGYGYPNAVLAIREADFREQSLRLGGTNRYETASNISSTQFESADVVYIANGLRTADALVMGILTKIENGPLLLSDGTTLEPHVLTELERLHPQKVVLIGGEHALSADMEYVITQTIPTDVQRIYGQNRFETALVIAENFLKDHPVKEVFLAEGLGGVDAISISSPSTGFDIPIFLTEKSELNPSVKEALRSHSIEKVTLVGGSAALSESVEEELQQMGIQTVRLFGQDRFETSLAINKKYYPKADQVFIANGLRFVDALACGPLAGHRKAPMVLVESQSILPSVVEYIQILSPDQYYVLGGEHAIGSGVTTAIQ